MSLGISALLAVVESHAMAAGYFSSVNTHEPENAPADGLTCAIWVDRLEPVRAGGLASTSVRLAFTVRIYQSLTAEPADDIDTAVMLAADALFTAYSGDFELGGNARHIDLLGAYGPGLSLQTGYAKTQPPLRIVDITLPIIINDAWSQAA